MGAVYRAARLLIGDDVAIKILHPEHVSERFQREAQAAARLKHPNAVFVYDFGTTNDGLVYLVMELLMGQSLRGFIKQEGPLAATVAAEILNQVCGALDEAHRLQIVHRDLKPDNIYVNPSLNGLRVKVLDFGIAKIRDQAITTLTQTGSVMGTPHYMSPEQCLGEEIDHRSDIYSLGIVLYEMLAGMVPFNSSSSNAVVIQHVNLPPPPLRNVNPTISPAVEAVVLQTLAKKREARPQSARALAAAFSQAVKAEPLPPPPPPPVEPVVPNPPPPTVVMPRPRPTNPDVHRAPPNGGGQNKVFIASIIVGALGLLAIGALAAVLLSKGEKTPAANTNTIATASPPPSVEPHPPSPSPSTPSVRESPPPSVQPSPPKVLHDSFNRRYQGTIGPLPFSMQLVRSGRNLQGTAVSSGSRDTLSGTIENDGSFRVNGYENGNFLTGIYSGQITENGTVTGYWVSSKGQGKRVRFSLREQ